MLTLLCRAVWGSEFNAHENWYESNPRRLKPKRSTGNSSPPGDPELWHMRCSSGNTSRWVGGTARVTHPCPYRDLWILSSPYGEASGKIRGLWQPAWMIALGEKRGPGVGWWGISARNGSGVWFQPLAWRHFWDSGKPFRCLWRWITAQPRSWY